MVAASLPNVATRAPTNKWLVTVSITFGTLMGTIDSSIVNVAMPHLSGSLGATVEEITWVTTGFVIANVVVMPLTAFLGRLFGQKRVYMFCLVPVRRRLARCAAWRARCRCWSPAASLQGLGAGALQPTEQAILRQTFPPEEQGMAMALFGMAVMLGPAFGPTLGGYIVDNYELALDLLHQPAGRPRSASSWCTRFVHEPEDIRRANRAARRQAAQAHRLAGIALLTGRPGLAAVRARRGQPQRLVRVDASSPCCAVVAVIALVAFVIRELTAPVPAVEPVAVQGQGVPLGHAHRRRDVRDADVDHVPPAASSCRSCSASPRCSRAWRSCRARSP